MPAPLRTGTTPPARTPAIPTPWARTLPSPPCGGKPSLGCGILVSRSTCTAMWITAAAIAIWARTRASAAWCTAAAPFGSRGKPPSVSIPGTRAACKFGRAGSACIRQSGPIPSGKRPKSASRQGRPGCWSKTGCGAKSPTAPTSSAFSWGLTRPDGMPPPARRKPRPPASGGNRRRPCPPACWSCRNAPGCRGGGRPRAAASFCARGGPATRPGSASNAVSPLFYDGSIQPREPNPSGPAAGRAFARCFRYENVYRIYNS